MRKTIFSLACITLFTAFAANAGSAALNWDEDSYRNIEEKVVEPQFNADTINIVDEGAVAFKKEYIHNQQIINGSIDKLSQRGGGVVLIPAGIFYTSHLTLKNGVNLHLSEGAELRFSPEYEDYLPQVYTRWEGMDCYNLHPLIYSNGAENIAVTGKGVLNGQASNEYWWWMKGRSDFGYIKGTPNQNTNGRPKLMNANDNNVPAEDRVMSVNDFLRPSFINFVNSENILLEGVTFINSPMWVIHPLLCNSVTIRDVYVCCLGPNNDGCDPESCSNVIIENCIFDAGDDCIAIKSGRNGDGRRTARPSENIIVRNCSMEAGHGGVVLGSEISGGARNIFVEDCQMSSPELKSVLRFKSSMLRGGQMSNIYARNITVGECVTGILVDMDYEPKEKGERIYPPLLKDFYVHNLTIEYCEQLIDIEGIEEVTTVDNIHLYNVNAHNAAAPNHISGQIGRVMLNGTELSAQ